MRIIVVPGTSDAGKARIAHPQPNGRPLVAAVIWASSVGWTTALTPTDFKPLDQPKIIALSVTT